MKKYLYNSLKLALAGSALILGACAEADKPIDGIFSDVERGAVLRTVEIIDDEVLFDVATSTLVGGNFTVVLEAQDVEQGALLSEVEVYFGFRDNTDEAGADNDRDEVLVETIPASAFSPGPFALPRYQYTTTADAIQAALNLPGSEIFGGDQFTIRFEMVLTDGRRFSFANNTGTLTGAFYNARFLHTANIVCAPSVPTAGTWTVSTTDTFGDGWNGASLDVSIDGGPVNSIANVDDGVRPFASSTQGFTFEVPTGAQAISIVFVSGDFDEEVQFTITSANGNVVAEGDEPNAGQVLDFCPDNL
ncbi:hypothetical protein ACFQZJ_04335 [Maribacter chungangensis]|uniref:DUF4382 domain-containing protein n=1 Tax=Maribacter chungangensis TaxID=1069117 RepID=A0ABW3B030_9FLAO